MFVIQMRSLTPCSIESEESWCKRRSKTCISQSNMKKMTNFVVSLTHQVLIAILTHRLNEKFTFNGGFDSLLQRNQDCLEHLFKDIEQNLIYQ